MITLRCLLLVGLIGVACYATCYTCPSGYGGASGSLEGCYKYVQSLVSWYDAVSACSAAHGGWLVSVDSDEENTYVYNLGGTFYSKWIGANDIAYTDSYVNVHDGQPVQYKNWAANEPNHAVINGQTEQCVQLLGTDVVVNYGIPSSVLSQWNDYQCSSTNVIGYWSTAYVCENLCPPTPVPTPVPTSSPTFRPTFRPSSRPSSQPSSQPTNPTSQPSRQPSTQPTGQPSSQPSTLPSSQPSTQPTSQPSSQPLSQPSSQPSSQPTSKPSSQPSTQPSSSPTSMPTAWAILGKDPFLVDWNWRFTRVRVEVYLGPYILYFACWFLLMFLLDKSGALKGYIARLLQSSFNAQLSAMHTRAGTSNTSSRVIRRIVKMDEALEKWHRGDSDGIDGELELSRNDKDDTEEEDCVDAMWRRWKRITGAARSVTSGLSGKQRLFPDNIQRASKLSNNLPAFYDYLLDRRCYLGCEGVILSRGLCGLPVGLFEDYILHVLNNHNILACSFAAKGSPFSREARRFCWITQHSVGFSMAALAENALIAIDCATSVEGGCRGVAVDSGSGSGLSYSITYLNPLIKIFIILPVTLSLSKVFRSIYTCSFTRNKQVEKSNPRMTKVLRWMGKISALPMLFGALLFLVIAAVLTPPGKNKLGIITKYALQVHLVSFVKELVGAALCMVHSYHLSIHILGVPFANIGHRYCEYILRKGLVDGVDYRHWYFSLYRDSIFHIDYVYPVQQLTAYDSRSSEISYSSKGSSDAVSYEVNPLHQLARGFSVMQLELVQHKAQQQLEQPDEEEEVVRESVVERGVTHDAVFTPAQSMLNGHDDSCKMTFSAVNPLHQMRPPPTVDAVSLDMPEALLPSAGPVESMETDAVQIKKFDKRIRRSFITKFHYWETRDRGYHREKAVDNFDLQHFKQMHSISEAGGQAAATGAARGVSATEAAMKMSKKVDLSAVRGRHASREKMSAVVEEEK